MKEIIKLLPQENGFKLKILGYQLLLILIMIIGYIVPVVMMSSYNDAIVAIGLILFYAMLALVASIAFYIYTNKLMTKFYPHFKVSMGDSLKKVLAAFIIIIGLSIVFLIAIMILGLIAGIIDFGLAYLLSFIVGVIVFFQLAGFALGLTYTLFENVDRNKPGFVAVFSTYFKNILVIRKDCVKIAVAVTVPIVVLYIVQLILTFVIALITIMVSPALYFTMSLLLIVVFTILMVWLALTVYVYIFKQYSYVASKMSA